MATRSNSSRGQRPGQRIDGSKRRDQEVIEAAARVFYRRGYADASVQDVADELGILKGSLYHYIDTKEDLLFRLLKQTHRDVERILNEVAAIEDIGPLDRLERYVYRQVEYNVANLRNISIYYHDAELLSKDRRREILRHRKAHEVFVSNLIEQCQERGLADPNLDPDLLSRCIFATIIWTYRWYRPGKDRAETVAELCAAFALRGVVGVQPK